MFGSGNPPESRLVAGMIDDIFSERVFPGYRFEREWHDVFRFSPNIFRQGDFSSRYATVPPGNAQLSTEKRRIPLAKLPLTVPAAEPSCARAVIFSGLSVFSSATAVP